MDAEFSLPGLPGSVRRIPVGVTWIPSDVLLAPFGDSVSGPAEALAALVTELDLDFAFVPAEEEWALEACELLRDAGRIGVWAVPGPFGRVANERGWARTLADSAVNPERLAGPLAIALHEALDEVRAGLSGAAGMVVVADELASQTGPLVPPDYALDALVPCYAAMAATATKTGLSAAFHSDGDVRALFGALSRSGFTSVHVGGLTSADVPAQADAARRNGLVLMGGLPVSELSVNVHEVARSAQRFAATGGFIVTDDGGIASSVELSTFAAAVRVVRSDAEPI
jgi:hypothetical protein